MKYRILFLGLLPAALFMLVIFFGKNNQIEGKIFQSEIAITKEIAENEKSSQSVKILFAGDLMLDRYNRTIIQKSGVEHFTKNFNDLFLAQDLNVVNLEGPVTSNQSVSMETEMQEKNHFKFTFDRDSTKKFLSYNKISLVNIGNNHIFNFDAAGAGETIDFLHENKLGYFGHPLEESNIYIEKKINGLKIALVNYNKFSRIKAEKIREKIGEARGRNDFVLVYAHWGDEYSLTPSQEQKNIAHMFVDNGADLIIGSHPHVVQPIEIYRNKAIFYSLGNFVFDQYFSEDVKNELLVAASFSADKIDFSLMPLYKREKGDLILDDGKNRKQLLERIMRDSAVGESMKKQIGEGNFSLYK
ncbi:MAG: capsule synthesis protein, CapA [uncultured bacterium]|nr:MAG: capsule synthesis protein, CapA [uncultured bacterium]HCU70640.1 hypothetical protein [Candidatus Moranbacteria bacterium]